MNTHREQLPRDVRRDAESAGGVLGIGDDTVHTPLTDEPRHVPGHGFPSRLAYDVTDEENFHFATSTYRLSRMTVTLIWPG